MAQEKQLGLDLLDFSEQFTVIINSMLTVYKSSTKMNFTQIDNFTKGCWISLVNPTTEEIKLITEKLGVVPEFLRAALDKEEGARVEHDEGQTLIIFDVPIGKTQDKNKIFNTIPLAMIIVQEKIITVSLSENEVIKAIVAKPPKHFYTTKRSRFVLQVLYQALTIYLWDLRQIEKQSQQIEEQLYESLQNQELIKMLRLQKSLVYFTSSLQSIETMLNKFLRVDYVRNYPDDTELLEDVIIENKQALEMANIYSNTLSGVMDAFASIISNNQNLVMKTLTVVTVIVAIPTLVFSFYGMNVIPPFEQLANTSTVSWIIPILFSVLLTAMTMLFLWRKKSL